MQQSFVSRLASRKFLLALAGALTMGAARQWIGAAAIIVTYIAGEAHVDAKGAAADVADVAAQLAAALPAQPPPAMSHPPAPTIVVSPNAIVRPAPQGVIVDGPPNTVEGNTAGDSPEQPPPPPPA